jgi:hypothetical protein
MFQDARVINPRAVPSGEGLRDRVEEIFGHDFMIERAETTFLDAREGHDSRPAVAFWMAQTQVQPVGLMRPVLVHVWLQKLWTQGACRMHGHELFSS